MKRTTLLALTFAMTPLAALAVPAVGDMIGTTPDQAKTALTAAGCTDAVFGAEGGNIEAKCTDAATGAKWEIYINPQTGAVVDMKQAG